MARVASILSARFASLAKTEFFFATLSIWASSFRARGATVDFR
jgi:hypothetical protein